MSGTRLMREALRPLYEAAREAEPHPGLLLQRGLAEHRAGDQAIKTKHVARVCESTVGGFYQRAYGRWRRATGDATRFRSVELALRTRLFIGLTGAGMLETGCVISHAHGAPCIPGSSIRGVVRAHARDRLGTDHAVIAELFGTPADGIRPAGLSGLITFHDAWWKPGSADHPTLPGELAAAKGATNDGRTDAPANRPLVQEVVTTHHPGYYGSDGSEPATDFDSPVPNAQVAVRGAFLFVIQGPAPWLDATERMLVDALTTRGAGAKTRAGYGLFRVPGADGDGLSCVSDPGRDWVEAKLTELSANPTVTADQALRGRQLAKAWSTIEDQDVKQAALADIRKRWSEKGWWDMPQGGAAKKARAIYDDASSDAT